MKTETLEAIKRLMDSDSSDELAGYIANITSADNENEFKYGLTRLRQMICDDIEYERQYKKECSQNAASERASMPLHNKISIHNSNNC